MARACAYVTAIGFSQTTAGTPAENACRTIASCDSVHVATQSRSSRSFFSKSAADRYSRRFAMP